MSLEIPKTILEQLGGKRFIAMTGAHSFVGNKEGLLFTIPKSPSGIKKVRIVLNLGDLYDIEYYEENPKFHWNVKTRSNDIFCEDLEIDFFRNTGWLTSL